MITDGPAVSGGSIEYWLVENDSGNAQGCYASLDEALEAAELETANQPIETLSVLAMRSQRRPSQAEPRPEVGGRPFVHFELGLVGDGVAWKSR